MSDDPRVRTSSSRAQVVVACADLDTAIAYCTDVLGLRLEMIMPADAPRVAVVSGAGVALRLVAGAPKRREPIVLRVARSALPSGAAPAPFEGLSLDVVDDQAPLEIPKGHQRFVITRAADAQAWSAGRAGMQYRDLIPDRCGGRFIASHIRIRAGGPVDDYVHHHAIRFQMIYCRRGWVRVVYEDQGPPFVMNAGDCVLQPPSIRHRVLESSPGLEVIEIACPAEHETHRDHDLALPTRAVRPDRGFAGQHFVRHVAAEAEWQPSGDACVSIRDTGIAKATRGLASARVLRFAGRGGAPAMTNSRKHEGEFLFIVVLEGHVLLRSAELGVHTLVPDDGCLIPSGADYGFEAAHTCELLEVAVPAAGR